MAFSLNLSSLQLPSTHTSGRSHFSRLHSSRRLIKTMAAPTTISSDYDRLKEVKQFDDSKIGVKGLVDSGLTSIPRFFHHPPETRATPTTTNTKLTIPVIDFSAPRSTIVNAVHSSSSTLGFFQIINHRVPQIAIDSIISSIKSFNEQTTDYKMKFYHREMGRGAAFSTNFDLYQSKAASWRDTLQVRLAPGAPEMTAIPEMCREAVAEWDSEMVKVGEELMGILCEGLGLETESLKERSCLEARVMVGHYYPYCPQPDLTVGITSHTDPGVLTVLVQNEIGGLQVKHGDDWVDVEPVPGALVINIGDILQIMSNDVYKSVEHRVVANASKEARVSVAVFYNPSDREKSFGPFPKLVSAETPAAYRDFTFGDFMRRFFTKQLDGKTLTNYYRI